MKRFYGLWEGIIQLPRPPPPFDIETMEAIEQPWQAIKEWIPDDEPDLTWFNQERESVGNASRQYDQRPSFPPQPPYHPMKASPNTSPKKQIPSS